MKPEQKDLREKLLKRKSKINCSADKSKLRKKKKKGDTEMLIAKMCSEDIISLKEETRKLMLGLKEEASNQNQSNIIQDDSNKGGRKEVSKDEDGKLLHKKLRNPLEKRLPEISDCSVEEYFKRRKEEKVTQWTEGETAKRDKLKRCGISEQDIDVKKQKKDINVGNIEKTKKKHGGKRTRKLEKRVKEYLRLKEKVTKNVKEELVKEILSEKGWEKKPDKSEDVKTYKMFKKLWKKKLDKKLAQCQSKGSSKIGDINDNVFDSEGEEFVQVQEENYMKEVSGTTEVVKVVEGDIKDVTLSENNCCVKEVHDDEKVLNNMVVDVAAVTEEVVSEEGSTEEEDGGLDISEDLKTEEDDPGYIQWKLAYLKSKLMELEEKEALGTLSTPEKCVDGGSLDKRLSGQIDKGDMGETEAMGSSLRVEDVELEEGEVIEAEACVDNKDEERVFDSSLSLPSGFLEAVVEACTRKPAGRRVSRLVEKKVPRVEEGSKKEFEQKAVLESASSSEPDPSALEHLDLRPPRSSYPPFTLMMHQQVIAELSCNILHFVVTGGICSH